MADSKVTALTAITSWASGDTLYVVDDPGGTPLSRKITLDNVFAGIVTQAKSTLNGAASTPPVMLTGTWFSGGSATTTKPQFLIEPTGTTSTAWSTGGTGCGINAPPGFAGNLMDLQVAGTSAFSVTSVLAKHTASIQANAFHVGTGGSNFSASTSAVGTSGYFGIGTSASSTDARLYRDAADTLALRRDGNIQTLRIYSDLATDISTTYERLAIYGDTNGTFHLNVQASGTPGDLQILAGSTTTSNLIISGAVATNYIKNDGGHIEIWPWNSDGSSKVRFGYRNFSPSGNGVTALGADAARWKGIFGGGTFTASSGTDYGGISLTPTYNQTGTAGSTDIFVNRTNTAIGSGSHYFMNLQLASATKVAIDTTGTMDMDKTTIDEGFINFKATADADTTSAISTLTTSGATTHHIQVEINGTKAWIAVSTNAPS